MNPIILSIIAAGGFLLISSKKSSSVPYKSVPLTKEARGYELTDDCKDFIISDYDKAMNWAFAEGRQTNSSTMKNVDGITSTFYGKCKLDNVSKTDENQKFEYELISKFLEGYVSTHPSELFYAFLGLTFGYLLLDAEKLKITSPINIPTFKKIILPIRGYTTDGCKQFKITNKNLMYSFIKNLSKKMDNYNSIPDIDFKSRFSILYIILLDFCKNEDFVANLSDTEQYMIMYNFILGQIQNGSLTKANGNIMLNNLLTSEQYPNIDSNVPKKI